jgi:hypothetical protein
LFNAQREMVDCPLISTECSIPGDSRFETRTFDCGKGKEDYVFSVVCKAFPEADAALLDKIVCTSKSLAH